MFAAGRSMMSFASPIGDAGDLLKVVAGAEEGELGSSSSNSLLKSTPIEKEFSGRSARISWSRRGHFRTSSAQNISLRQTLPEYFCDFLWLFVTWCPSRRPAT